MYQIEVQTQINVQTENFLKINKRARWIKRAGGKFYGQIINMQGLKWWKIIQVLHFYPINKFLLVFEWILSYRFGMCISKTSISRNVEYKFQNLKCAGGNIFIELINVQTQIRPCWWEFFLEINKRACTSIWYTRVYS